MGNVFPMRETNNALRSDKFAPSGPVQRTRRGRPYSPLTQWLRPQIARFQAQGYSCRNVFLVISAYEEDASAESFVISPATADLYRHELGDIAGLRVTWGHFRQLWQRIRKSTHEFSEVPDGR